MNIDRGEFNIFVLILFRSLVNLLWMTNFYLHLLLGCSVTVPDNGNDATKFHPEESPKFCISY